VTRRVVFRPQAEDDALEVRQWYEARRVGLGAEFGLAVDEIVARVVANPLAFQRAHGETRRAVLARFPYAAPHPNNETNDACKRTKSRL